jgi:hypothetical protein
LPAGAGLDQYAGGAGDLCHVVRRKSGAAPAAGEIKIFGWGMTAYI